MDRDYLPAISGGRGKRRGPEYMPYYNEFMFKFFRGNSFERKGKKGFSRRKTTRCPSPRATKEPKEEKMTEITTPSRARFGRKKELNPD